MYRTRTVIRETPGLYGSAGRRRCSFAAVVCLSLLLPVAARAEQSELSLRFDSQASGTSTAMHLRIVYRNPHDPDGKPSPIRHLETSAPPGTRFNLAMARCTASDDEIMSEGPSACPANSQVGKGTLTAITGFGPPIDPYPTDVTIFNTGQGILEIISDQQSGATLSDDRIEIKGNVMIGNPPAVPGGPPDGQTAVRTIDFTFPASTRYITTPPSCTGGEWTSNASFTFADGTTQHVSSTTPCNARRAAQDSKPPRVRVRGVPQRCVRRSFKVRVRARDSSALKRVTVRLDGRSQRTTQRKRFTMRVRVRGLRPGRHRLSVVARDAAGNRAEKTVRFRRCRRG